MSKAVPSVVAAQEFARQWQAIRDDALDAVDRVGRSGWLILGEEVEAFESELASWWGVAYTVGVGSGLDALEIALRCAGVKSGDRVLTTPLTAFATTIAIIRTGAQPVWCDVDESGGIDLGCADDALRRDRTIRALLPVHLYGHPIDAAALSRLADEHGVALIEDCAQSAGAERGGVPTGAAGIAAGTSLYPTKNLGAMGDGGVLLTNDDQICERARRFRDYGQSTRYEHTELGSNSRLDELQAAILRSAMLPRLDGWIARRREVAGRYLNGLAGLEDTIRPILPSGGRSSFHLFAVEIRAREPELVAERIRGHGVAVNRHYPFVCPDQPAARGRGIVVGDLAVARRLAARELSLPIHPHLSDEEVECVIEACREACR
jgi:dTDP-3-amino-3,4,6-trideoxy-alpha-D-glucose transaminase